MNMQQRVEPADEETTERQFDQIGQPVVRTDAEAKVTGAAPFTNDMFPEDVVHAKLVTSDEAHARLVEVDTSAAETREGVLAVATGEDAPDNRMGHFVRDKLVFPTEKVRHVGEPVAVVAAETEPLAREAAQLVEITYDPLEPVYDMEAAAGTDPPAVVHEDVRGYETDEAGSHVDGPDAKRPNLLTKSVAETGDLEAGFEAADLVFEDSYEIKPIQHCAMEYHVALARADAEGATLWSSHQIPHVVKRDMANLFPRYESDDLVVKTPFVGGAFGGKETPVVEPQLLTVAQQLDRPVKLALSRKQQYATSPTRPEFHVRVKDGVSADGDLLARSVSIRLNAGGYNFEGYNIGAHLPVSILGSYDVPAVYRECESVYTNRPPCGAFRGWGLAEVNFAVERHMDQVAETLGLDPLEYRRANLLETGDRNALGQTLNPAENEAVLQASIENLDPDGVTARHPEYDSEEWEIGVGHAYGNKGVPSGETAVRLELDPAGEITAHVGAPDVGQGSNTAMSQLVAEEFGIDVDDVTIVAGDTDRTEPDMQGPSGSRFTPFTGNAIRDAATTLTAELQSIGADILGADPEDIEADIAEGQLVDATTDASVSLAESPGHERVQDSPRFSDGTVSAVGEYEFTEESQIYWVPVSQAAVVACNTLTGQTDVLRMVTAADVGQAVNPETVEQQLEGGAGMGIGQALYEELAYDGGAVENDSLKTYSVPTATELPYDSETIVFESVDTEGPFGAKSVGEVGILPTAPAIADAVADALGIDVTVQPITPERVLAQLD